jgi:Holliday junction resolvase RusA-like endonuclease
MVTFFVYGLPLPQGSKSGRVIVDKHKSTPQKTHYRAILTEGFGSAPQKRADWRQNVYLQAMQRRDERLPYGPITLTCTFYLPRPKSAPKHVLYPAKKPDLSKLVRAIEDSMTGVLYTDDGQIVDSHTYKRFAPTPAHVGVAITLEAKAR